MRGHHYFKLISACAKVQYCHWFCLPFIWMTLVNFAPQWTVCYIILYADDILLILISPSVAYTERLLHHCEQELSWLDMNINFRKSCCLRIGPRCDIVCEAVTSSCNRRLPWVSNMRYLGVHFVQSMTLKCSLKSPFIATQLNSTSSCVGEVCDNENS